MNSPQYHPFPNTHWSLVRRAGAGETQTRGDALTALLIRYEPALKSYLKVVRRLGDDSDDILQSFISDKLLEKEMLQHADERRGKFRTFLLSSLNNFIASRYRSEGSRLRAFGGDTPNPAQALPSATSSDPSPAAAVEAVWARTLVREVLTAMQAKCKADGRDDIWTVFEARVLTELFEDKEPIPYENLAADLRLTSPSQAANLLVTAKRLYARLLRVAVSEYERDESQIESEIADLRAILARAPVAPD